VREDPAVWEDLGCTAEGSPGADHSPGEADRNLEVVRRTAVVADHTAAGEAGRMVAAEVVGRRGYRCSTHRTDHDHREQHHQEPRESHRGEAVNLNCGSLLHDQKWLQ
jgi:hypothetical protein